MSKKKIIIAVGFASVSSFILWLFIDVFLNGKIRYYTYSHLLEVFSYGWERFRLFLYVAFALLTFMLVFTYFIIPNIVIDKQKKHEQKKLKLFVIDFFEKDVFADIGNEYAELKDILLRQKLKLTESENKKNEMISNIAHDLKTPLTSILGYLMLLNDEENLPQDIRKKYTEICIKKSEQLNKLVNEFFELTQYSAKDMNLNKSKINLTQLIEQITDEFYPLTISNKQRIFFDCDIPVYINADGNRIGRVFENIIKNAINYTANGKNIEITLEKNESKACVTVSNECAELSENQLKRIFERSYRIDDSRNSGGNGGLGLSIAKEIVDAHGGDMYAVYDNNAISIVAALPLEH